MIRASNHFFARCPSHVEVLGSFREILLRCGRPQPLRIHSTAPASDLPTLHAPFPIANDDRSVAGVRKEGVRRSPETIGIGAKWRSDLPKPSPAIPIVNRHRDRLTAVADTVKYH